MFLDNQNSLKHYRMTADKHEHRIESSHCSSVPERSARRGPVARRAIMLRTPALFWSHADNCWFVEVSLSNVDFTPTFLCRWVKILHSTIKNCGLLLKGFIVLSKFKQQCTMINYPSRSNHNKILKRILTRQSCIKMASNRHQRLSVYKAGGIFLVVN